MVGKTKIIPRYAETDKMGIVHHSVYAIWYEQARTDLLNEIGLRYDEIEKMGVMTPLVELNCKYYQPAYYNHEVEIITKIVKLTPARFILQYELYNKNKELINLGTTTLAWADANTFKIINLKKKLPKVYEKMESLIEE